MKRKRPLDGIPLICMMLGLAGSLFFASAQRVSAFEDFVCTIRTSGGDYTNLPTWEAAIESDLTAPTSQVFAVSSQGTYDPSQDDGQSVTFAVGGGSGLLKHINTADKAYIVNLTGTTGAGMVTVGGSGNTFTVSDTGTQIGLAVAECYNDWPAGLPVSATIEIDGFTSSSNHYARIYVPLEERHTGTAKKGANYTGFAMKWTGPSYKTILHINDSYTRIQGLILDGQSKYRLYTILHTMHKTSTRTWIDKCIVVNGGTGHVEDKGLRLDGEGDRISNTLVYNCAIGIALYDSKSQYAHNCTVAKCTAGGFHTSSFAVGELRNCLAYSNNVDFACNTGQLLEYCASSDGTAADFTGTGNRTNQVFRFKDEANNNYKLTRADTGARHHGTNLFAHPILAFEDDIDSEKRRSLWDIGADQVQPPAGTVVCIK